MWNTLGVGVLFLASQNIGFTYQKVLHTRGVQTLAIIHEKKKKPAIKMNTAM